MANFSKEDLFNLQNQLETRKNEIKKRIESLKLEDPFNDPDRVIDNASSDTEASEESNHDRVTALINELNQELVSVDFTLSSIANNSYGTCKACGIYIGDQRLKIIPTASLCLDCEAKK